MYEPPVTAVAGPAAGRFRFSRATALAAALVAATLIAFAPVVRNGFVNYDDDTNLMKNLSLQRGLNLESLRWAFTNVEFQNWIPLTWISHILDFQFFGMQAGGHHAVSALIHAANAALLFALCRGLTGAFWRSALVAGVFALHPLRVESVAWAAERKDVLSLFFGFLALLAYLRHARRPTARAYAATILLFLCSLMSKAMLVTLPALLLLLDLWPLNRWSHGRGVRLLPVRRVLLEKVPFLAISAAASVLAFFAQASTGAVGYVIQFPLGQRVGNAFRSYAAYLGKTFWPTKLAVFYPYFWDDVPLWQPVLGAVLVAAVSIAVVVLLRRRPFLFVGWAWYLGTFLPVIGIVQIGSQSMADRYTYFPQIGILLMLAWGLGDLARRWPPLRTALLAATVTALVALTAATWAQASRWRSSETLFTYALRVTKNNYIALSNLGAVLAEQGREEEGNAYIKESFRVNPVYRAAVFDRSGDFYAKRGQAREAGENYRKALEIEPFNRTIQEKLRALGDAANPPATPAPASNRHGAQQGSPHGGAPATMSDSRVAYERGNILARSGRRYEAVEAYREAIRKEPGYAEAWNNLGCALGELGRKEEAAAAFEEALRLKPDHAAARTNLDRLRGSAVR